MKRSLLAFALFPTMVFAQTPSWQHPPKLVVGIVVDQMRADYIYRYWDNFGEGGFKRLIGGGTFLRDAHYNYMPTVTGPGHASIYTGTTPSRHGIVANEMYDRTKRIATYCVVDTAMKSAGTTGTSGQKSPHMLLATTLADELELRFDGRAKTIGISLKDRSAILPIGRTGDAAYWYSGGSFISSSWYMQELPQWVIDFNAKKPVDRYMTGSWDLILPQERYHEALPDDNPYEIPLKIGLRASLPVNLDSIRLSGTATDVLPYTPWGNTITTDMALAAIDGEAMGKDAITDLLAISYSSTDLLGHRMGPRAVEVEDMYIRLDREIARLLAELDKSVGVGQYTVFLTADHGAADVPAYLKDRKGSAGYVQYAPIYDRYTVNVPRDGLGQQLDTVINDQVFFRGAVSASRADDLERFLRTMPGVAEAATADGLLHEAPRNELQRMMLNGYMPGRSGDVLFVLRPGYFEQEEWSNGHGTTHGTPWTYDTHVPVIFYGAGVHHTEVLRPTTITDIAPTISAIIGMTPPNACDGAVVNEAVIAP